MKKRTFIVCVREKVSEVLTDNLNHKDEIKVSAFIRVKSLLKYIIT